MPPEIAAAPAAATPAAAAPAPTARASILADMAALRAPAPAPTPLAEEKAPAEAADPTPEADPADLAGEPPDAAAVDDDEADVEVAEPDAEPTTPDPDRDKRIAAIQREEKRQRAAVDAYRRKAEADLAERFAELDRRRTEHAPALERFQAAQARAKVDPIGFIESVLGADVDHDYIARQAHSRTKAAAADPRYREAADRAMRERDAADKLAQLDQKLADIDRREQERERQSVVERNVSAYLEKTVKAVGDDSPLVKTMMAKNPEKTRQQLHRIAVDLSDADPDGTIPSPADVVKALEQFRRDELAELGIDPSAVITKATLKKPAPVAGEKKRPVTPSTDPGNSPEPRSAPRSREDERAQIVREMREAAEQPSAG